MSILSRPSQGCGLRGLQIIIARVLQTRPPTSIYAVLEKMGDRGQEGVTGGFG